MQSLLQSHQGGESHRKIRQPVRWGVSIINGQLKVVDIDRTVTAVLRPLGHWRGPCLSLTKLQRKIDERWISLDTSG